MKFNKLFFLPFVLFVIFISSVSLYSEDNEIETIADDESIDINENKNSIDERDLKIIEGLKVDKDNLNAKINSQNLLIDQLEQDITVFTKYGNENKIINTKNITYIFLFLLIITIILITIVLLRTISWRRDSIDKAVENGEILQFPHETNELIKNSQANIQNFISQLAELIKENTNTNQHLNSSTVEKIGSINEQLLIFNEKIEKTESELKRYKEGYDLNIKQDYLKHLIKLNSICKAEKNIEQNNTMLALDELIDDYMDQENIVKYSLNLNKSIQNQREARTITENTNEESKAGLVIENIEPGYLIKLPDGEKVLKPAFVKIFKYTKNKENTNE